MVSVTIGGETKELEAVSERWINESINRPKAQGLPVCVQVSIREGSLRMGLTSAGCAGGGGGGRAPNALERGVFRLWEKLGLNSDRFRGGNLVAFLKQLQRKYL